MMQGVCHVPNKISCNIELQTKYQYLISTRDKTSFSPQKYNLKGTTRHKICLPTVILKFWPWWWPLSGLALHYLDFYPNTSLKRNIFFETFDVVRRLYEITVVINFSQWLIIGFFLKNWLFLIYTQNFVITFFCKCFWMTISIKNVC